MAAPDPLDALRDIHAPAALASAQADLALAALAGFLAAVALALLVRFAMRLRRPVRRAALEALAASRALPAPERVAAQATLLRRLVRTLQGEAAARERGSAWLARLDRLFATDLFTRGAGSAFGVALYAPAPNTDPERTDRALAGVLARLRR